MPRTYARKIFIISLGLLFIVPMIWLTDHFNIQKIFPWLVASLSSHFKKTVISEKQDFQAELVGQSHSSLKIKQGEEVRIWVDFRNVGKKTWVNDGAAEFIALNTAKPQDRESIFKAANWEYKFNTKTYRPGRMSHGIVAPGDVGRFYITFQAPQNISGDFEESFQLVSEWREWIQGGEFSINLTIEENKVPSLPKNKGEKIKIGLLETEEPIEISASGDFEEGAFEIRDDRGELIALYHEDEIVRTELLDGQFNLLAPAEINGIYDPRSWSKRTNSTFLDFIPKSENIGQIVSLEARPHWNPALNDNRFRGILRLLNKENKIIVLNQLFMEEYLRGLAETSNDSSQEWQKALSVAARSYAQAIKNQGGKHLYYDLDATSLDQVYKGFSFELRSPNYINSLNQTTGEIITYKNKVVITPYFSQSDGRTRSWSEVWSGEKPWLVSVPDPYCQGKELKGHGVGMSALGAREFIEKENKKYKEVLKYYYKDIEIKDFY